MERYETRAFARQNIEVGDTMKKKEQESSNFQENLKNPRTRAFIFFGFYFVFFVVLFIILGNSQNEPQVDPVDEIDIEYQFDLINEENYHFVYQVKEDEKTIVYEGDKNLEKELFTVKDDSNIKEYFNNDNMFLVKNELWELGENPYSYPIFFDVKEINRLVKNSTLISKTEFSNNDRLYQYEISTTTLLSLLEEQEVDLMDEPNKIHLYVNEGEVYKIELDLTPYISYQKGKPHSLQITLEYTNFGEIQELDIPKNAT